MKKISYALIFLITISVIGCGSTQVEENQSEVITKSPEINIEKPIEDQKGLYYKNNQTREKLLIDDWKYKGFGNELPEWVIPALEEDVSEIKKIIPELSESQVIVLKAEGYNHDQAEMALAEQEKPENFTCYDSFWVRISSKVNEKTYISISVYYRNDINY